MLEYCVRKALIAVSSKDFIDMLFKWEDKSRLSVFMMFCDGCCECYRQRDVDGNVKFVRNVSA